MDHSSKAQPDLDSPVQPSREVPNERDEDEESVEETPPPSPMPPKCKEQSTPNQQCPQSTSATEPEDTGALIWLNAYGASQTPAFDSVTSRPFREQFPYLPIPAPGKSPQPVGLPTNPLASPPFGWVKPSPGSEAARLSRPWDRQSLPVSGQPPQPAPTQRKWYNEVKNLRTNEFSHTEATKHHGSPSYFPHSYPVLLGSPTDPRATATWLPRDPPPPSPSQSPCYRPTSSSRGAPSTIAGSSRPAWSVSSSVALPKLHTKGHRQEPYASSKRPRAEPTPSVSEKRDDLVHRVDVVSKEVAASVDETDAALPIREKQPVADKGEEA